MAAKGRLEGQSTLERGDVAGGDRGEDECFKVQKELFMHKCGGNINHPIRPDGHLSYPGKVNHQAAKGRRKGPSTLERGDVAGGDKGEDECFKVQKELFTHKCEEISIILSALTGTFPIQERLTIRRRKAAGKVHPPLKRGMSSEATGGKMNASKCRKSFSGTSAGKYQSSYPP